jgi:protease stability complex PrcB-like protein
MRPALMLISCLTITGCGASPTAPDTTFRLIAHGGDLGVEATTRIINDAATWSAFIQDAGLRAPSFKPDDAIPAVNFSSETTVALSLGQRPTGGYQIRVERVTRDGSTLLVHASELVPCVGPAVITHPLTVIAVPKFNGRVDASFTRVPCLPAP